MKPGRKKTGDEYPRRKHRKKAWNKGSRAQRSVAQMIETRRDLSKREGPDEVDE